jgi:hypothetical protein
MQHFENDDAGSRMSRSTLSSVMSDILETGSDSFRFKSYAAQRKSTPSSTSSGDHLLFGGRSGQTNGERPERGGPFADYA